MASHRHLTWICLLFWLFMHSPVYGQDVACSKENNYVVMCKGGCNTYKVKDGENEVTIRTDSPSGCVFTIQAEPGYGLQVIAGIYADFATCRGSCGDGPYASFTDQVNSVCKCGGAQPEKGNILYSTDKPNVTISYRETAFAVVVKPMGCATSQLFSGPKTTFTYKDNSPKNSSYIVNVTCPDGYLIGRKYSYVENRCNIAGTGSGSLVGTWEKPSVRCRKVKCAAPLQPFNGFYTPRLIDDDFKHGESITYDCIRGYRITSGQRIRTCLGIHTKGPVFTGSQPVCSKKDCEAHPHIPHSTDNGTSTLYNSSFSVRCNRGYWRDGPEVVTCQQNGIWSTTPTCKIVVCSYTPNVPHAEYRLQAATEVGGNPRAYGNVFEYTCHDGFRMSGNREVSCLENGTYSPLPVCIAERCNLDDLPVSPTHRCRNCLGNIDVAVNSTRLYSCLSGYVTQETVVACQMSGSWSSLPACQRVDCGEPAPTDNGIWSVVSTKYDAKANLTCEKGYRIDNSNRVLTCSEEGEWVNGPTCTIVHCGAVPTGPNLVLEGRSYTTYNSKVIYGCTEGHFIQSRIKSITCLSSGHWTAVPHCQKIDCGTPSLTAIANGTHGNIERTIYNTEINYTCDYGFMFASAKSMICLENGTWSERPQCVEINCGVPEDVPSATLVSSNSTGWNGVAIYTCNLKDGEISDTRQAVCREDGRWAYPSCPQAVAVNDLMLYVYIGCGVGVVLIILVTVISVGFCFKKKEDRRRRKISVANGRSKGKAEGSQCSNDSGLFVEGDPGESEHAPSLSNYEYRNTASPSMATDRLDVPAMPPYSTNSLTQPRSRQPIAAQGVCLEIMSVGGSEEELRNPLYGEKKMDRKCSKNSSPCDMRNSPNISTGMNSPLGFKGYEDNHPRTLTPNSYLGNGINGSMDRRYPPSPQNPRIIPGQELNKTLGSDSSLRVEDYTSVDTLPAHRLGTDTPSVAF